MYKNIIAIFCMILFICLPIAYADVLNSTLIYNNIEQPENYIGEEIIVEAVDYFPKVLKSSLIEEQDVNVQVLLSGIPTNPSITIPKINNVHIISYNVTTGPLKKKEIDYSKYNVSRNIKINVTTNASKTVTSTSTKQVRIGSPKYVAPKGAITYNNLGYLVIPIKRIPKEADVPDQINIQLLARIEFSVSQGLNFGEHQDVLQEQNQQEWMQGSDRHRFFAGYIRASQIRDRDATFVVYDDAFSEVTSVNVNSGSSSGIIKTYKGTGLSSIGNLGQLFTGFKINVKEIRGTTNVVKASIFTGDQYITTVLREGSSLYSGSEWRTEKINILNDKIVVELRNNKGEKSILTKDGLENYLKNLVGLDKDKKLKAGITKETAESKPSGELADIEGRYINGEQSGNYDILVEELKDIVKGTNEADKAIAKAYLLKIRDYYAEKYKSVTKAGEQIIENIEPFGQLELIVEASNMIKGKNDEKSVNFIKKEGALFGGEYEEPQWIGTSTETEMDLENGGIIQVKRAITDAESINILERILKLGSSGQDYLFKAGSIETFLEGYDVKVSENLISSSYYQKAIEAYQKVKVLLLKAEDPDDLKARSQHEIAKIYKTLKDNNKALQAYNDLMAEYSNTNYVKANKFMIDNEFTNLQLNLESKTVQLDDNGNLIEIRINEFNKKTDIGSRPKAYFEARDHENGIVDVCKKETTNQATNEIKNVCEEGELINKDSEWTWKVETIYGDNVLIKSYYKVTGQLGDARTVKVGSSTNIQYSKDLKPVRLTLKKIDMKREVLISITPNEEKALSDSQFNVHIPIEKRAIGLPLFSESLDEEINRTENLIKKLDKIIVNLEKLHNAWIKFCYATFAFVWVKNFLTGGAAARQKVMGNWRERYEQRGKDESKLSYEEYVFKHSKEVDKEVTDSKQILSQIKSKQYESSLSEDEKKLSDADKKDLYYYREMAKKNPDDYNVKKYLAEEVESIKNKVDAGITSNIKDNTQWSNINQDTKNEILKYCGNKNAGEYNTKLTSSESDTNKNVYFMQNRVDILDCYTKGKTKDETNKYFNTKEWTKSLSNIGVSDSNKYDPYMTQMSSVVNPEISRQVSQINKKDIVKDVDGTYSFDGKILNSDSKGTRATEAQVKEGSKVFLDNKEVEISKSTEGTNYPHAKKVTLVQSGRNEGMVEMISIDAFRYAQVSYTSTGAIQNIDVYQRHNANDKLGTGSRLGSLDDMIKEAKDDRVFEVLGQKVSTGKQNNLELLKNVKSQVNTLNKETQYKKPTAGQKLKDYGVEKAAPKIQGPSCVDYMSPGDCKLLFNACDPVVCPASRCNAGGRWQVDNVVKTGVIGSVMLCLPNMKQGIVMPVCLTGILAGLQNIKSILRGYAECLKVAKTKGESVGICDRVRNLYICDILWKEGLAIFNVEGGLLGIISKGVFGGQGGQEYSSFKTNFDNSVGTLKYFTQDYAKGVFAGYAGGSLEEIGSEICKSAIYAKVPGVGDFFSEITKPESPPQFLAFFDESIYSDIKAGGESQYSVYYHIYAGENEDIQYSVYLRARDTTGKDVMSPVFVRKNNNPINNVKLVKGGFADENIDFVAKSGYKEVCVQIRSNRYGTKTECGFGKVTSDFGINYLNDLYISSQLGKQIKTAEECVPETGRLTTLNNDQGLSYNDVSLGQVAIGSFSTGLTQTGIIRKCSGYDPDVTTNSASTQDNWRPVGNCGKDTYGRDLGICYLYVPGVSSLIKDAEIRDESLKTIKSATETLAKQGLIDLQLYSDDEINKRMDEAKALFDKGDYKGAITYYEDIVKHTLNEQKAGVAQFEVGNSYKKWAESLVLKDIINKRTEFDMNEDCKKNKGKFCASGEYCKGNFIVYSNEDACCLGECVKYSEQETTVKTELTAEKKDNSEQKTILKVCDDCNTKFPLIGFNLNGCIYSSCLSGDYGECYYGKLWDTLEGCKSCDDIKQCLDYTLKASPRDSIEEQCSKDLCKIGNCEYKNGMCDSK